MEAKATREEGADELRVPKLMTLRSTDLTTSSVDCLRRQNSLDYVPSDRDRLASFDDDRQCCTLPRLPSRPALAAELVDVVSGGHEIPMMTTLADCPTMRADPPSGCPIVSGFGEPDFIMENSTIGAQENITVVLLSAGPLYTPVVRWKPVSTCTCACLGHPVVSGCLAQNSTTGILLAHAGSTAV